MKLTHLLLLAPLVTGLTASANAQSRGVDEKADSAAVKKQDPDARRAKKAQDEKNADRAKNVRGAKAQDAKNADRAKAVRDAKAAPGVRTLPKSRVSTSGVEGKDAPKAVGVKPTQSKAAREAARREKVVAEMTTRVRDHRVRGSELDRLEEYFAQNREREKMNRVQALRTKENDNYAASLKDFEKRLGKKAFEALSARLRAGKRK